MPTKDILSDDYVAALLTQDAKDSKYPLSGLHTLFPKRPTTNAPKPNTRFLRNIIKETDSHNAALHAREAQDAKLRFQKLHTQELHQLKTIKRSRESEDHHFKRRRLDHGHDSLADRSSDGGRGERRHHGHERDTRSRRHRGHRYRSDEEDDGNSRRHRHKHHHRHRSCSRSRSEEAEVRAHQDGSSKSKKRSRASKEDGNHSSKRKRGRERSTSLSTPETKPIPKPKHIGTREETQPTKQTHPTSLAREPSSSDSDPLEHLVGPLPPPLHPPPPQARGRGKFAAAAATSTSSSTMIDSHFSAHYDPTQDIGLNISDSDHDDWDQALEALRDRQRWKQQGAERLRLAGFTDEEVGKWERGGGGGGGGGERREEDVVWNKRGEGREWDRGKVVGEDGGVETRAEWGRLKGT